MKTKLIGDAVTMQDVISMYEYRVDKRAGRIKCPFHNGKDNNFSYNDKVFHCFVCGVKGNALSYVAQRFNLPIYEAAIKIDEDFSLGIIGKKPSLLARKRVKKQRIKDDKQQREIKRIKLLEDMYIDMHRELFQMIPETPNPDNECDVQLSLMLIEVEGILDRLQEMREGVESN